MLIRKTLLIRERTLTDELGAPAPRSPTWQRWRGHVGLSILAETDIRRAAATMTAMARKRHC